MSNKIFNHKLTVLSVSLLALFLGGCAGGTSNVSVNNGNAQVNGKPSTDASAGTDAGKGTGSDAGKGTDTGATDAGKGTDTGAGKGTDAGTGADAGAGKGTDAGTGADAGAGKAPDAGTDSQPAPKVPEFKKAYNSEADAKKDLEKVVADAKAKVKVDEDDKPVTGYSFTAPYGHEREFTSTTLNVNPKQTLTIGETEKVVRDDDGGESRFNKVDIKTSVKTNKDGSDFTPDEGSVGEVDVGELESKGWTPLEDNPSIEGSKRRIYYKSTDNNNTQLYDIHDFGDVQFGVMNVATKDTGSDYTKYIDYNLFYRGKNLSQTMPTGGTIHYEGGWAFATDHFTDGKGVNWRSGLYQSFGTVDKKLPNTVSLDANFADKTLTGTLSSKDESYGSITLGLNAKIKGNTFAGTATVDKLESSDSNGANGHRFDMLSEGESDINAQGSFFGDNASQLGGYLKKGDDFAGVFAAKQSDGEGTGSEKIEPAKPVEPVVGAYVLPAGTTDDPSPLAFKDLTTLDFGDGHTLDITNTSYKDIPFEFLSFGSYTGASNLGQNTDTGYFAQGYITPVTSIPTSGKVYFAGQWYANTVADGKQFAKGEDARYVADFGAKNVQGFLYSGVKGTADVMADIKTATEQNDKFSGIHFNASIDGNQFEDKKAVVNIKDVSAKETGLGGTFFGTKDHPAEELAGAIISKDINGVFAGKRTK